MISCPICNKEMNYINNSHLKTHKLTPKEFKENFPEFNNISDSSRKLMGGNKQNAVIAIKEKANENQKNLKIRYDVLNKCCLQCNKPIQFLNRNNKFCNNSCSASFNNKNRTVKYSKNGYENLKKIGKENMEILNKKTRNKKSFKKECVICGNQFFLNYRNKLNKSCSKECRRINHSLNNYRQNKTFGKCGYYQGVFCASSWELAFLITNKDLGKEIKRCDLKFSYKINNLEHTYFPDFMISNIIYEIKGREFEDVVLKIEAVKMKGYKIKLIRRKEILPMIKLIKEKYKVKDIINLYDK